MTEDVVRIGSKKGATYKSCHMANLRHLRGQEGAILSPELISITACIFILMSIPLT